MTALIPPCPIRKTGSTEEGSSRLQKINIRYCKPFQKRLDRKLQQQYGRLDHNPFEKRLDRKLQQQYGRHDQTVQRLGSTVEVVTLSIRLF
ncbi:hypothetical protein [Methanosarcina barkeri]|uniref:hypothetical protein n=1 Tax=Methanosarcina barkeri TaxID=2208 RepID=UPI000A6E4DB0|nr:hypothetical protein [Methanosarcina barkeri]